MEPVQSLDWLPDTLYHGTRDLAGVLHHGLRVKDAYHALMGNPDVGWRDPYRRTRQEPMIEWAPYVWGWYRRLSPEGKRKLKAQVGEFSTADNLGERVGLIWTLPYKSTVGRGSETGEKLGATVVLDSKHLSVLGAFNADEIKGEIVLVVVPDTVVSDRTSIKSIIREVGRTRRCPHCGSERFHISQSPKVKGRRPITFDTGTCDKCNRQFPYSEGRQEEQQLT